MDVRTPIDDGSEELRSNTVPLKLRMDRNILEAL
jgi:hypothetical protein